MKFNNLKSELSKWKRSEKERQINEQKINVEVGVSPLESGEKPGNEGLRFKRSEKVVGGDVLWKPIDKAAAMLLAKSPWWAHPPHVQAIKILPEKVKHKKKSNKMKSGITSDTIGHKFPTGNEMSGGKTPDGMANLNEITVHVISEINRQPQALTSLARAAIDARGVLDENLRSLGDGMDDFNAKVKVFLESVRQTRFCFVSETSQMLGPLKEIRQFFLASDYKDQIERLKEFVDLCERLQKLKASGFLDSVADTMLRLAV